MMSARERAIRDCLVEELGGPVSYVARRKAQEGVESHDLDIDARRLGVNRRRTVVFGVLYVLIALSAMAVVVVQSGNLNAVLWVAVATFNAVSAAVQFGLLQKRRLALRLLELLCGEDR